MNTAAHTPGPWTVGEFDDPSCSIAISGPIKDDGAAPVIADVYAHMDVVHANARLIAAAPELLAALKDAVTSLEFYVTRYDPRWTGEATPTSTIGVSRAVIAKAEGRS